MHVFAVVEQWGGNRALTIVLAETAEQALTLAEYDHDDRETTVTVEDRGTITEPRCLVTFSDD
jgi:hypothetical protein